MTAADRRHALVIQHLETEGPVAIASAFARAGIEVRTIHTHLGDPIPTGLDGVAALVVMGGPMSATTDDGFPTRRDELALLDLAVRQSTPTLGVCLGAQLLALAAGGSVHGGHGPEIGWAPITLSPSARDDVLFAALPATLQVLHWHGDTYTLPPAASPLASSTSYEQQAFRVGHTAWGLQFHLEVDAAAVNDFVEAFPDDAAHAPGGVRSLAAATDAAIHDLARLRDLFLDRFVALAAGRD